MKQKLGIAYAILNEPDIIVLDEPINALDENAVDKIKKNLLELRDKGKLIIVACHDREELDYLSDEIYVMSHGRLLGLEGGTQ
jgi:ABC-2 type transport system ATP-binding protein